MLGGKSAQNTQRIRSKCAVNTEKDFVRYADKKLTVKNTKSLVQSGYTHVVGSSQGALYSGYVKSDVNMYVDIVLAVGGAEQTFRVNFISGVNGISLADGVITF